MTVYECEDCADCPYKEKCTTGLIIGDACDQPHAGAECRKQETAKEKK